MHASRRCGSLGAFIECRHCILGGLGGKYMSSLVHSHQALFTVSLRFTARQADGPLSEHQSLSPLALRWRRDRLGRFESWSPSRVVGVNKSDARERGCRMQRLFWVPLL